MVVSRYGDKKLVRSELKVARCFRRSEKCILIKLRLLHYGKTARICPIDTNMVSIKVTVHDDKATLINSFTQ